MARIVTLFADDGLEDVPLAFRHRGHLACVGRSDHPPPLRDNPNDVNGAYNAMWIHRSGIGWYRTNVVWLHAGCRFWLHGLEYRALTDPILLDHSALLKDPSLPIGGPWAVYCDPIRSIQFPRYPYRPPGVQP